MTARALVTLLAALALDSAAAAPDPAAPGPAATDPFAPLAAESRPLRTRMATDYRGEVQLGLGYTGDDNYMFGQYNGLEDQGASLIGNLHWQDYGAPDSYWRASASDLGLATREGQVSWGRGDQLRLSLGFDSQQQVRNDSGATPFSGDSEQTLPDNWQSGLYTADFTALDEALHDFDRKLDRDKLSLGLATALGNRWRLESNLAYEEKQGHGDIGAGIYSNGSGADAVLLRSPVDYATTDFDLGLAYDGGPLQLQGQVAYSGFDNGDELLTWQNPYSSYGPDVRYPNGSGGLALAPDSEQFSGRLTGHYVFSARTRLQFDGSYALASQDEDFLDYSVNPALLVYQPLPANSLDGDVATSTLNARLLFRALEKLDAELYYRLRDRDYGVDRDGYLYIRGDGADQPGTAETVYNTGHNLTSQTAGFEAHYPLPLRSRLTFGYAYERAERQNDAVATTEEDRFELAYRVRPWPTVSARLSLLYGDRAADTYQWDQSYFALLDSELINATPDTERYSNHPALFQYYMANRERWESKADLTYAPGDHWSLALNLLWRDDDYDQSALGLTGSEWRRAHFSASYALSQALSATLYTGVDRYEGDQGGRSFRGGQEKNAFAIYPPLPQASDPQQDWDLDATDTSFTAGASLNWQPREVLELEVAYSYVDTTAEQDLSTRPGGTTAASSLPDVDTRLHQLQATGKWHLHTHLSLQLDYRYYNYESDDWAWDNVRADTIDKVLGFGQDNPDEDIHYVGTSVIYRWR